MPIFTIDLFGITLAPTWYGLMYALGLIIGYTIISRKKLVPKEDIDDLLLAVFIGIILGGRIGYILFYDLSYYLRNPYQILAVWRGGMSFHGALIGVIIASGVFARIKKLSFFSVTDALALVTPIGLGLGRIGNYINGELPGFTPYDGPLAMIIRGVPHFPSPLLQSLLEWPVLLAALWYIAARVKKPGILGASFLTLYALARITSEFFRLPDPQIGYLFGTSWLTMGHALSAIIFIAGSSLLVYHYKR